MAKSRLAPLFGWSEPAYPCTVCAGVTAPDLQMGLKNKFVCLECGRAEFGCHCIPWFQTVRKREQFLVD